MLRHLVHVPEGPGPHPLVLFLHGSGERGDNLEDVARHGPPRLIAEGRPPPAMVVSPQCPANGWWTHMVFDLLVLLDEIELRYPVDTDRVVVTGLSMGGYGTWALAAEAPGRFAAAMPVCGGGTLHHARRIAAAKLPVWAFHGDKDDAVPHRESVRMVDAIVKGGGEARLTTYPGVDHDSWTRTYEDAAIWEWLLEKRRRP